MHVGMNRPSVNAAAIRRRVPHARGDEPFFLAMAGRRYVSSPCTWG